MPVASSRSFLMPTAMARFVLNFSLKKELDLCINQAEEHNTCIEVAEGGWCSTHVDQEGQFQEGRYAVLFHHVLKGISHC